MPYIKPEDRPELDNLIDQLTDSILATEDGWEGNMNYSISRLTNNIVQRRGKSYRLFNAIVGVIECVKMEVYRRLVVPYELRKSYINGDVFGTLDED